MIHNKAGSSVGLQHSDGGANAMRIIGYCYEADYHCVGCTIKRSKRDGLNFGDDTGGLDANGIPLNSADTEGNLIHPMFSTDEQLEPQFCGDCLGRIE